MMNDDGGFTKLTAFCRMTFNGVRSNFQAKMNTLYKFWEV